MKNRLHNYAKAHQEQMVQNHKIIDKYTKLQSAAGDPGVTMIKDQSEFIELDESKVLTQEMALSYQQ